LWVACLLLLAGGLCCLVCLLIEFDFAILFMFSWYVCVCVLCCSVLLLVYFDFRCAICVMCHVILCVLVCLLVCLWFIIMLSSWLLWVVCLRRGLIYLSCLFGWFCFAVV